MSPCALAQAARNGNYVDGRVCASCHPAIDRSFRLTGMGRSFSGARPVNTVDNGLAKNPFYHKASDTWFTMAVREGRYLQRRYQIGFDGKETNIDEKSMDFVMGSGNHVRTYLHQTAAGALEELPLAWYAEKGGYWAMNPGYDTPDQPDSRRKITYECMFCHNSYPEIPQGHEQLRAAPVYSGQLPEGIDCQRCHGPGGAHVRAAQARDRSPQAIRDAIVNPARLAPDRQMEVCMQCHLETTSFRFPHSIQKYDRGPFSYRAGEPLADFLLFFDQAKSAPDEDRFQIVNSVYRLRMSQCFLKSGDKLQCTTCHDPHASDHETAGSPGAAPAATLERYNGICRQCHAAALDTAIASRRHTAERACVDCHMPKRRTDDVVHAVMTDHYIRRRPPLAGLTAAKDEPNGSETFYHGEVAAYYPAPDLAARTPEYDLYLALAQVRLQNNTARGISQFRAALDKYLPQRAEFYIEYADALVNSGKPRESIEVYEDALRKQPDSLAGLIALGQALDLSGQTAKALENFKRAAEIYPDDALSWQEAGQAYMKQGQRSAAIVALQKSIELDSDVPEAHYALGTFWAQADPTRAEASFREAIRLMPDYAQAHLNLAILLSQSNRLPEAAYHFKGALRARPDYPLAHLNYALMLRSLGRAAEADVHLRQARDGSDPTVRDAARRLLQR
jgi:tetratricopeptide (TPR) repeat protein